MKFSIIVPVYNAENYLQNCIGSVLAQTYTDWELILIDDGSEEKCADLCDDAAGKDGRIRAVHKKNEGQLSARLDGIAASGGDYIVFLDADDLLSPDCLKTLHNTATRLNGPDLMIYSFLYEEPDGKLRPAARIFDSEKILTGEKEKKDIYLQFLTGTLLNNVWTKAVKKSVFSGTYPDYAPFSALRVSEDRLFSMGILTNSETIVYLPEQLYVYRLFPGSVTRRFSREAVRKFNTVILYPQELDYLRQWDLLTDETRARLKAQYISHVLYVFDLFYRNMKTEEEKSRLTDLDWKDLVPEECLSDYHKNPYLNDTQKRLFSMLLSGDKSGIKKHYIKKSIIKSMRSVKQKLSGN